MLVLRNLVQVFSSYSEKPRNWNPVSTVLLLRKYMYGIYLVYFMQGTVTVSSFITQETFSTFKKYGSEKIDWI